MPPYLCAVRLVLSCLPPGLVDARLGGKEADALLLVIVYVLGTSSRGLGRGMICFSCVQVHVYSRTGDGQMPYEIIDGVHIHRVPIALDPDFITECGNMWYPLYL